MAPFVSRQHDKGKRQVGGALACDGFSNLHIDVYGDADLSASFVCCGGKPPVSDKVGLLGRCARRRFFRRRFSEYLSIFGKLAASGTDRLSETRLRRFPTPKDCFAKNARIKRVPSPTAARMPASFDQSAISFSGTERGGGDCARQTMSQFIPWCLLMFLRHGGVVIASVSEFDVEAMHAIPQRVSANFQIFGGVIEVVLVFRQGVHNAVSLKVGN